MPAQQTIALLGAPGTGAPELAEALNRRLMASALTARVFAPAAEAAHPNTDLRHTLHSAAVTLLMGLDTPCAAPEQARRAAFDSRVRALLADAAVRYQVVYGQGPSRTENALNAINLIATKAYPINASGPINTKPMRLRAWDCEKCSDPDCEHRLFSALTGGGAASGVG